MKPELMRRLLPSLVLNIAVPLVVYLILNPVVGSEVVALAISAAIPLLVTVGEFAVRRRLDPIGVVAVVGFVVMLALLGLTGGNELVVKLQDAVLTGPLGLVLIGSAAIGKPLLLVVHRFGGARQGKSVSRRALTVLTALIGGVLVLHAAVLLALAVSLPTTTYLAVGKPIGWAVIAAGLIAAFVYRNRVRAA
ncbi:VC0807 family protein [Amycolatopsis rhabdoformis]|uniref:VC0807 family protein n=1 Tax=Amycolatopsis rhabdoformis TaxID=1448059 RepID=A0ABZ1IBF8_9PSEU|nr:VC0807 family protein [Amycolatopsis rhabdoformis]WSE30904.1 VC0807 family protein [Amycolatopsis rhabdoformis]